MRTLPAPCIAQGCLKAMTEGFLSRDRKHLARLRRERRAQMVRIDYMPCEEARAMFLAVQATKRPRSQAATNSAVLDAIVIEWAELTGIKKPEVVPPKTTEASPELSDPKRARAYDFGVTLPSWAARWQAERTTAAARLRVQCGARRHRDGLPCKSLSEPGKKRCRFHGGRSTGPRSGGGKARSLRNLKQYRPNEGSGTPHLEPTR